MMGTMRQRQLSKAVPPLPGGTVPHFGDRQSGEQYPAGLSRAFSRPPEVKALVEPK